MRARWLVLARLALRNTLRQARRSALTASAMVVGLALLMMSRAIGDGAHEQWITDGVRLALGHVALEAPGWQASGSLDDRLDSAQVSAARRAVAELSAPGRTGRPVRVRAAAVRLTVSGLASSPGSAVPVRIEGVDPSAEAAFSELDERLASGRYLEPSDRLAAFVGAGLADRLGLHLGSRLVLTAQGAAGDVAEQLVRVRGLFRTGIPEVDDGLVQIPLSTARQWLGTPGAATAVSVLLGSSQSTSDAVEALRARLGSHPATAADGPGDPPGAGAPGIRVLSWKQASPELESAVRIDDFGFYVFMVVLFAIVALAVLNAVLMSVLDREREFGVLEALGLTRAETGSVVFTEGLLLAVLSGILGVALGFGVTWLLWRHGLDLSALYGNDLSISGAVINPVIVPIFRPARVAEAAAYVVVIGGLASLYPARVAMRIDVAEALKFDR